jgi:hypothetical protein
VNPALTPSAVDRILDATFGSAAEYFTLETFVDWLDRVTQDFSNDRFDRVVRRMVKYHAHDKTLRAEMLPSPSSQRRMENELGKAVFEHDAFCPAAIRGLAQPRPLSAPRFFSEAEIRSITETELGSFRKKISEAEIRSISDTDAEEARRTLGDPVSEEVAAVELLSDPSAAAGGSSNPNPNPSLSPSPSTSHNPNS